MCLIYAACFQAKCARSQQDKNQGNEKRMMCMEKDDFNLYLLQLGVAFVTIQGGNKGCRIKDRWLHLVQVVY